MEIIVGKTAGFCYGVNRAVEGSKKILKESKEGNIYCLGGGYDGSQFLVYILAYYFV